jgi:hypothetical protein
LHASTAAQTTRTPSKHLDHQPAKHRQAANDGAPSRNQACSAAILAAILIHRDFRDLFNLLEAPDTSWA